MQPQIIEAFLTMAWDTHQEHKDPKSGKEDN